MHAVILSSTIYLGSETGLMRNFMEPLFHPYITYTNGPNLLPKDGMAGFIYTMNMRKDRLADTGLQSRVELKEYYLWAVFGNANSLLSCDTYQFSDYSLYESNSFDPATKEKRRTEVFSKHCKEAFQMGVRFVRKSYHRVLPCGSPLLLLGHQSPGDDL